MMLFFAYDDYFAMAGSITLHTEVVDLLSETLLRRTTYVIYITVCFETKFRSNITINRILQMGSVQMSCTV